MQRKSKRIHSPKEQGAAMVVVMFLMVTLAILGVGSFQASFQDFNIAMNRSYAQSAEMIAHSALHLVINRIEKDPMGFVTALDKKQAESQSPTGCEQARTLCITPASFFPPAGGSTRSHRGFHAKSLLPDIQLTGEPSIYPDFTVMIQPPIKSPYTRPAPGMSLNNFAKMCTITLILTATGKVINPNITNTNSHRHTLAQRIYRVHLNVAMKGDPC